MTIDASHPGPAEEDRPRSGLGRVIRGRLRRPSPAGRMRTLRIGGRTLRVAVREGTPGWPPLLLCNGIGASLELLQPFVDALDPRRGVIRFDMPGVGGSPALGCQGRRPLRVAACATAVPATSQAAPASNWRRCNNI